MSYCTKCGKPTDNEIMCEECIILDSPWLCAMKSKEFDLTEQIKNLKAENAALRERLKKAIELPFYVFDKKTGKEADTYEIVLNEDWAKHLMYCDIDGFAIEQDGTLVLIDECGQIAYCSSDRFEICSEARLKEMKGDKE